MSKVKANKSNTTKKKKCPIESVLASLENGCTVTDACESAGISRVTFYKWKNASEENEIQYLSILDSRTLTVEDSLYNKALNGDTTAMIFWLKNRAPARWKDKVEHVEKKEYERDKDEIIASIKKLKAELKVEI